jgi:tetratricopeptide (TPR) repeat protein
MNIALVMLVAAAIAGGPRSAEAPKWATAEQPGRAQKPAAAQAAPASLAPAAVLSEIAGLLDRQDWASARTAVDGALRTYPDDAALHNFAGVIDAESHAAASAESHFQTAIRLAPRDSSAYENLGRLYQERAATDPAARDKAIDVYRRLLAIDPRNVEGLYQSAFLLALAGKFSESRGLIDRLPNEVRQQSHALALAALDLAATGDPGATAAVTALAAHPGFTADDVTALLPALDHLKDDEAARSLFEALDRRGLATAATLQRLGRIHLGHQRYAEARAMLERAATAAPSDVSILVDLARAADRAKDHEGALGYLAHARALAPNDASIHFLFGIVCVEMDLVGEAYDSLKKAVALAPDNPQINYVMGSVAMHRHEPAESLPYFEKYIALLPDDPRGRFALGVAQYTSGMLTEAKTELTASLSHPETSAGAHYFLGRIARQENDLATALREVTAALRQVPTLADGWAELGLIQTRLGSVDEAQRSLDKALAIDPDHYQANVNLGTLYSKTKDPRREAQAARIATLQEQRNTRAQDFLRVVEVVP